MARSNVQQQLAQIRDDVRIAGTAAKIVLIILKFALQFPSWLAQEPQLALLQSAGIFTRTPVQPGGIHGGLGRRTRAADWLALAAAASDAGVRRRSYLPPSFIRDPGRERGIGREEDRDYFFLPFP